MTDRRLILTPRPERQPDAETLAWIERIETIRQAEAPACCPTCGSTTVATQTRRCRPCGREKPLSAFPRNRSQPLGRAYTCRACKREQTGANHHRVKRLQFRALLSQVAS